MYFFKGIIHVHSNYSYDGQHTLSEIAEWGEKRGYSFICMSEHSETFDEKKMLDYIEECEKVSRSGLLIIPGIEFSCNNGLHILGLGIKEFIHSSEALEIVQFIKEQNGLIIIAHPCRYNYQIPLNLIEHIHGIEIWNAAYDGRFIPNPDSIDLFKKIERRYSFFAYGGLDLHKISDNPNIEIIVSCNEIKDILLALRGGNFVVSNPYFMIDSSCRLSPIKYAQIFIMRRLYLFTKAVRDYIFE